MNLKVKHTVKQTIIGAFGKPKTVKTVFTSKDAAERYAASVGGTVEAPTKTTFGAALAAAIMTAKV